MCYPGEQGGLGFRSLFDINKYLMIKLWWNFRTRIGTMWGSYMGNRYCKRYHLILAPGIGGSHVWRSIIQVRDDAEPYSFWQIKAGLSSFFGLITGRGLEHYTLQKWKRLEKKK